MARFSALKKQPATADELPDQLMDLAGWWESPTRKTASALQPRTWLQRTKLTLPVLGAVLLLIAFIWPAFLPAVPDVKATLEKLRPGVVEELAMFDLNYKGTNKAGTPFAVEAAKAVRTGGETAAPLITLTTPQADMTTKDGNFMALTSNSGVYNEKAQALQLEGDVEVLQDNGTTILAPVLEVDFASNSARTTEPVAVHGEFGEIKAPGMVLEDGGDRVIFTGTPENKARAVIKAAPQNGVAGMTIGAGAAMPSELKEPSAPPVVP